MLNKKDKANASKKYELLIRELDRIISGDISFCNLESADDPEIAKKVNDLVEAFFLLNNKFVMRANSAMEAIGDNSNVKAMLDQVILQSNTISEMESSSHSLLESIDDINQSIDQIKNDTQKVVETTQTSALAIGSNIGTINDSTAEILDINNMLINFHNEIDQISEIIETVKGVANQSNLLALNASIEAARAGESGKGFAVVADQVRVLSSSTSDLADKIVSRVKSLQDSINEIAPKMDATTKKLQEGALKIEGSIKDVEMISSQMNEVNDSIIKISSTIDTQANITNAFSDGIGNIISIQDELHELCRMTGQHIYKIGRYVDTLRSDMFRECSDVTIQDQLRIFQIDHFILTWRIYNHAMEFETLRLEQVNNASGPKACKLGKWIQSQTDSELINSTAFKAVDRAHKNLHEYCIKSWEAKDAGDQALAIKYFGDVFEAYKQYSKAIDGLMEFERKRGNSDVTEIKVFGL